MKHCGASHNILGILTNTVASKMSQELIKKERNLHVLSQVVHGSGGT